MYFAGVIQFLSGLPGPVSAYRVPARGSGFDVAGSAFATSRWGSRANEE